MDPRPIVGKHFENLVIKLFDLRRADWSSEGKLPDLVSKDGSFYVEVKASAYTNGGVIKSPQINKFDTEINQKRFYAFCYHSIKNHMENDYKTENGLIKALDLKSLYMFPFSIVKSFYDVSKKRYVPGYFNYVQLRESTADRIFKKETNEWAKLNLDSGDYSSFEKANIHILFRKGFVISLPKLNGPIE